MATYAKGVLTFASQTQSPAASLLPPVPPHLVMAPAPGDSHQCIETCMPCSPQQHRTYTLTLTLWALCRGDAAYALWNFMQ